MGDKVRQILGSMANASYSQQDINDIINAKLRVENSDLRCFRWSDDKDSFVCGRAEQSRQEPNSQFIFHDSFVLGRCPKVERAFNDHRGNVAIFQNCMAADWAKTRPESKSEWTEWEVNFAKKHEAAHSQDLYLENRLVEETSRKFGWKEEGDFHHRAREILADSRALEGLNEEDWRMYKTYRQSNTIVVQATRSAINVAKFREKYRVLVDILRGYERELSKIVQEKLNPLWEEAMNRTMVEKGFDSLTPTLQRERIANEMVRLYLERDPAKGETIRKVVRGAMELFK